ncbi:hypothetical protein KAR91_39500 [Candidatus Pacearchaeota archaeon]|nr:hypothetical protein [Candidatus Pacearchaeota archaeon]
MNEIKLENLNEEKIKELCEAIIHGIEKHPSEWAVLRIDGEYFAECIKFEIDIEFTLYKKGFGAFSAEESINLNKFCVATINILGNNFESNNRIKIFINNNYTKKIFECVSIEAKRREEKNTNDTNNAFYGNIDSFIQNMK